MRNPMTATRRQGWWQWMATGVVTAACMATVACPSPEHLVLATGSPGGAFQPLGQALAQTLESAVPGLRVTVRETAGGAENAQLLASGQVELALLSNDTPATARVQVMASLYTEVLHVVLGRGVDVHSVAGLGGRRLSIGPEGSTTHIMALGVLRHFGAMDASTHLVPLAMDKAVAALHAGKVDAAFVLSGVGAPVVEALLAAPGTQLLALGDPVAAGSAIQGLRVDMPWVHAAVLPERAYRHTPTRPVGTVGVRALLGVTREMPTSLVRVLTEAVYSHRAELADRLPLLSQMVDPTTTTDLHYPVHAGALDYFHRNDPPFLVIWADAISLVVTLLVLLWSSLVAVRSRSRRVRKDRVDLYYLAVQQAGVDLEKLTSVEDLRALRTRLNQVRRQAFDDLVAERLDADESFTIFQDYVRSELLEVEAAMRAIERSAGMR